jgi:uncharacterized protein (TIGR00661 family)
MKIVYGVSGEGFGHSSRSKEVIKYLKKQKHEVLILTYDRGLKSLKEFKPLKIPGLNISIKNNKIKPLSTLLKNIPTFIKMIKNWPSLIKKVNNFAPDLLITDFEPTSARIAYNLKIPLISLDNQQIILKQKIKYKKSMFFDYLIAKLITKLFIPKADYYIIITPFSFKSKKPVFYINPIIRNEISLLEIKDKDFILVYLTRENQKFISLLKKQKKEIIIYSENIKKDYKENNIQYKKFSPNFKNDLSSCSAVIGSAGLSLLSECLYLKKPYFALPNKRHFEQFMNAEFIKKQNIGGYSFKPNEKEISSFLNSLVKFKKNLNNLKYDSNHVKKLLDNILKEIKTN